MTGKANLRTPEAEEVQLPEWVTLHEAAFITRLTEEDLRIALASAGVGSVSMLGRRSRARHAGRSLILVRTDDLRQAGLLEPSSPAAHPAPQYSIWSDDEPGSIFGPVERRHPPEPLEPDEIFGPSAPPTLPLSQPTSQVAPTEGARPARATRGSGRRVARAGLMTLLAATLALAAGLVLFTFAPIFFGYHTFVAASGSMSPSIKRGSLLLERSIPASQAKVDDVVTFRDPQDPSRLVTSRVKELQVVAGVALFTTQGDASSSPEEWSVPVAGRINRVSMHIGRLGGMVDWLRTGIGLLVLALTPLAVMLLLLFTREKETSWSSVAEDPFWKDLSGQRV